MWKAFNEEKYDTFKNPNNNTGKYFSIEKYIYAWILKGKSLKYLNYCMWKTLNGLKLDHI